MFAIPPPLHERAPMDPSGVERVVTKALAKDPKERFMNVQAFANALEQASESQLSTILGPKPNPQFLSSLPPTQPVANPLHQELSLPPNSDYPAQTKSILGALSYKKVKIWSIGIHQVMLIILGAVLFGGLSYLNNTLQLPTIAGSSIRPGIVIPLFFGVVFGPWVGLFTGGVGNLLNDLFTGTVYWNWDLGNGLIGFVAGLALYFTWGHYNTFRNIAIAEVFSVIGIIVGLGFAAFSDIWVSQLTPATAVTTEFIPATIPDIVLGLILLPILLVAYNAAMTRAGRA